MKKRTAFFGAILSLISLGQPLFIKTGVALSTSGFIFFHTEQVLSNSFNVDYDNAVKLFEEGNYNQAISKFNNILKKHPNLEKDWESYIYLFLAMSYGYLNKHYAALEFNNKSISLNPMNATLYLDRANTKFQLGDKRGACLDMGVAFDLGDDLAGKYIKKWSCN